MRLLFENWREVSHNWLKERVNKEAAEYEKTKREQELTQWDKEVDALKIYMAQL